MRVTLYIIFFFWSAAATSNIGNHGITDRRNRFGKTRLDPTAAAIITRRYYFCKTRELRQISFERLTEGRFFTIFFFFVFSKRIFTYANRKRGPDGLTRTSRVARRAGDAPPRVAAPPNASPTRRTLRREQKREREKVKK